MTQQVYFTKEYFLLEYFPLEYWVIGGIIIIIDPRRVFVVPMESRVHMVEKENREFVVPPKSRTIITED